MELLIYGAGVMGQAALELMTEEYQLNYEIAGFIDRNKRGQYCGHSIYKLEDVKNFKGKIIIALFDRESAIEVCEQLKASGNTDIFWFQHRRLVFGWNDFFTEQCIDCKAWKGDMLPQAEMHIIDSCNLNCRGCAHFSPIFPNELPDLHSRLLDIKKLKEKVSHIIQFYILGGEPFLNPEITEYVCRIRRILPDTQLYIVTNGLLIEKLEDDVLECIKDNRVWISISEYKPTHKRIDNIRRILETHKVMYEIRDALGRQEFNLPFSLSAHSKYPKICISNGCVTIWNGKLARCPQLMYVSHFNAHFNTRLPEEGVMNLNECATGKTLLNALKEEVPLCSHCIRNEIDWSVCGKEAVLEDFAVYD